MPNISTDTQLSGFTLKQTVRSGPSDWPFVHALTMLLICVLFSTDYLAEYYAWMPRIVTWAPEMVSALLAPFIVGRMAFGTLEIAPKYMLWGLAFICLLIVSALIHQVQPGAVFYGIRKYARYIPVFLVPILFPEIRERFRHYLWLLLLLTLLQVPMAWWQWATMRIGSSGDAVEGTVTGSGVLTVYLTSSIALLTAFYVKKKISLPTYAVLAVFLTIPTWLNESTATIFLLPVAVAAPIFLAGRLDARKMIAIGLIAWGLLAAFFASYAAQYSDRWGEGGLGYVISGGFIDYLYRGADTSAEDYGHQTEIGRLDSVLLPFQLTDDPVRWLVGVGPGNASTVHNDVFKGEFSETAERYGVDFTTASALVWETGLLGLIFSLVFLFMIFRDSRKVAAGYEDWRGGLALGWASVCILIVMSFLYHNLVDHTVFSYLMWLFCGQIVALRTQQSREAFAALSQDSDPSPAAAGTASALNPGNSSR